MKKLDRSRRRDAAARPTPDSKGPFGQQPWRRGAVGALRKPRHDVRPFSRRPMLNSIQGPPSDISVAVFLDTTDEEVIEEVLRCVEGLRAVTGYGGAERDISIQRGSIFRRSWAAARKSLSSRGARNRLHMAEQALELAVLNQRQAQYDHTEAVAASTLITSLRDVPRACIRVGSILLVKFPTQSGESAVRVRNLSPSEVRALERFPEIQRGDPEAVEDALH